MRRAGRRLAGLERRPWTLAVVAGAGVTLLVPSALALYGPPELLDAGIALGDARLAGALASLFVLSTGLLRLLLRRRRLPEEAVDEEPAIRHPTTTRAATDAPSAAARSHLR
jgi:hypothetical protein